MAEPQQQYNLFTWLAEYWHFLVLVVGGAIAYYKIVRH